MVTYLDASVVVPHFIEEMTSGTVDRWLSELGSPAISTLAIGEFSSAIARLTRMGSITHEFATDRLSAMDEWCAGTLEIIENEPSDLRLALLFVRRIDLGLRMPDAIHVATCRRLGMTLATFDTQLAKAATVLGVATAIPA